MEYIKHSWLKNVTLNVRESMHDGRQLHVEFVQPGVVYSHRISFGVSISCLFRKFYISILNNVYFTIGVCNSGSHTLCSS